MFAFRLKITYVMCCAIWYQSLFGICMIVSTHSNAWKCFFYLPVVTIHLHELAWPSNGSIKSQTLEYQSNGLGG